MKILNTKTNRSPREPRIWYVRNALGVKTLPRDIKILDWGGNCGNLLRDCIDHDEIDIEGYTCVDVDQIVIELCKREIPEATWMFRPVTSPTHSSLEYDLDDVELPSDYYDVVVAYNVFNHMTTERFLSDLDKLLDSVKPNGKLLLSYTDILHTEKFILKRRKEQYGHTISKQDLNNIKDYIYFINNDTLTKKLADVPADKVKHFINISNKDWLEKLYNMHPRISSCHHIDAGFQQTNNFLVANSFVLTKG